MVSNRNFEYVIVESPSVGKALFYLSVWNFDKKIHERIKDRVFTDSNEAKIIKDDLNRRINNLILQQNQSEDSSLDEILDNKISQIICDYLGDDDVQTDLPK